MASSVRATIDWRAARLRQLGRSGLRGNDARQLVEKGLHVRRERGAELVERAAEIVTKRGAGERFEQRPAEVQRAQLGDGQAGGEALEGLSVQTPAGPAVIVGVVVVDREADFLEGLQIAPDRSCRHPALRREPVDGDPRPARLLDFAEDGPLSNDFGVSRHGDRILEIAEGKDCRIAGREVRREKGEDSTLAMFANPRGGARL